jgi:NhaP-type Na+/H+ or K+/H+ antiporter
MEVGILLILLCVVIYSMLAKRLASTVITAPMVFICVGFCVSHFDLLHVEGSQEVLYVLAEIALIVLLFLDASQIHLKRLVSHNGWPVRMLVLGLPLSILIGTLIGMLFFPSWSIALIALTASILAPTDAALSEAVVNNKAVPEDERQTLSAESGLNDGLALPIILFFASFLAFEDSSSSSYSDWLILGGSQIFIGILVGVSMGWGTGRLLLLDESWRLSTKVFEGIGILALIGVSYLLATLLGGNGFIAAFVGGLTFGNIVKESCRFIYEFTESEGQMLIWAAFTIIGLGLLPEAIVQLSWPVAGYILVSLFFVRPLAIYIALIGSGSKISTRLFFGWFGPRGLATALFALLVSREILPEYSQAILVVAINAVWMSTLLHGVSAAFLAKRYGELMRKKNSR